MAREDLHKAKKVKNDEFYTQLEDIEQELKHYKSQFKGKVVFCNCDDPYESNFFRYFVMNFKYLGLKRLIATSYKPSPIDETQLTLSAEIFGKPASNAKGRPKAEAKKFIINDVGDIDGDGAYTLKDVAEQLKANKNNEWQAIQGDKDYAAGDFRSRESIELLEQADIVVTNPPFSLFREYLAQLVEYDKKFLIIGNKNSITYKEVFKLIKENKLWLGYRNINSDMWFELPGDSENYEKIIDGKKVKHIMACWLTNLDTTKRHQMFDMYKKYTPEHYPKYDNYDAINVNVVAEIPHDYMGAMGVPITFLDKFNPDQFDIVGLTSGRDEFECRPTKRYIDPKQHNPNGTVTSGSKANTRATILLDEIPNKVYYTADNAEGPLQILYARILIKRKETA